MNPMLSVICYLGSLPSPGRKTVFHSSCFCCCCCLVFWVLLLTFQQTTPCRNGFRQVCLRQKKNGEGQCTAYFHTFALGNYLPIWYKLWMAFAQYLSKTRKTLTFNSNMHILLQLGKGNFFWGKTTAYERNNCKSHIHKNSSPYSPF